MNELSVLENIRREMEELPGHLGFYYKNLVTGTEFAIREDEIYGAASIIKFPLFLHILAECDKGNMSLDDRLVTEESDKVPSCGALNMFTGAVSDYAIEVLTEQQIGLLEIVYLPLRLQTVAA
jgi:beta-lactamase class A